MDHAELVEMIRDAVAPGVWADLGSGAGAFTLALADLLGSAARIYSVDRDGGALRRQQADMAHRYPSAVVDYLHSDFTRPLALPPLDGVVMANSLHFVRRKEPVLSLVHSYLREAGRLVLIEYDSDSGNPWVPHPLSFRTWERLSASAGFRDTRQVARRPSRYLNAMYSALSFRSD